MKTCTKCGVTKPLFGFHKNSSKKDGLQSRCKNCLKQFYRDNCEILSERQRECRKSNPAKKAKIERKYREANPEKVAKRHQKYREDNREKERKRHQKYIETYPYKVKALSAKYRATKLQSTPPWLTPEHHAEMALCYEEAAALRLYTGQQYHVDHIVPLQGKTVCGLHVPWNLQVLLARDNLRKGNKLEMENT